MLLDVGIEQRQHGLVGLHQRRLGHSHVRLDVGLVILPRERLRRHHHPELSVLQRGALRLRLRRRRQDLVDVLDLEGLIHPPVGRVQVVHLRVGLGQLQLRLGQRHALRHGEDVRVADRDDVDATVEVGLDDAGHPALDLIRVVHRGVLGDHPGEDAELVLLGVMQALVDRRHHLHAALEQGHGRADRRLLVHVRGLHVGHVDEPAPCLDQRTKQLGQRCRRLLVRQRDDRVPDVAARSVHVAELARLQRLVTVADPDALGLEARREVGQRACIDQLAQDRGGRAAETAHHVGQAEAVEAETGQELVVGEVLLCLPERVELVVVPADRQHLGRSLVHGDDVRQLDSRRLAVRSLVLEALDVEFAVDLVHLADVVAVRL